MAWVEGGQTRAILYFRSFQSFNFIIEFRTTYLTISDNKLLGNYGGLRTTKHYLITQHPLLTAQKSLNVKQQTYEIRSQHDHSVRKLCNIIYRTLFRLSTAQNNTPWHKK